MALFIGTIIVLFTCLPIFVILFTRIEVNCDDIKEKQESLELHLLKICKRMDEIERKFDKEISGSETYIDILYEKFCRENPTLKVDKEILTKVFGFCNEQGEEVNKNENK